MFRRLSLFLLLALGTCIAMASENAPHHSLIRVFGKNIAHEKLLLRDDMLDVMPQDGQLGVLVAALPEDFAYLQSKGYRWDTIHQDLEDYYARRGRDEHGSLDLMGGYKTYTEINAALDSMHAHYPNITTAKFSIGQTLEGREIYCIKISDNPDQDENEIEMLYDALIHAREPAAMEVLFLFMDYLTQQYNVLPAVTDLVNNREFYFVPCINADGYVYNQTTNPNGGGMWRKNRKNNGNGSFGVDLNRNWGFNWGFDNSGSSPTPASETYRGTGPFSEPETQVMRNFIESRDFTIAMNYHTYSNLILYSWGSAAFQGGYTPEDALFQVMGDSMQYYIQQVNGAVYTVGPPWAVLYDVNGDCNDWCYGEQTTKERVFGFTTEVGGDADGFWPAQNRILPLAQENLPSNLFIARYAANLIPQDYMVKKVQQSQTELNGDNDGLVEPGENVSLSIRLKNTGALDLTAVSGTLTTSTPNVTVLTGISAWPAIARHDTAINVDPFVLSVGGGFSSPGAIMCSLHLTTVEGLDTTLSVSAVVGNPSFHDDMESGAPGWTHGGNVDQWHLSTRRAASPTHSWYCGLEGAGQYSSNQNAVLTSPTILLGNDAVLTFSHFYQLESDFDFGFVEVVDDAGAHTVAGPFTGTNGVFQTVSVPLTQFTAGSSVQIRFRQTSDGALVQEGWYVDDVFVGPPPQITASPASITAAVDTTQVHEETLVIGNVGGSDLVYSVAFQNGTVVADTGGPDAYGYRWQDSDDPCGPIYSWLPISAAGTQITWIDGEGDYVKGPYALPFDFPFYGTMYDHVFVSANGWISFVDSLNQTFSNIALPSVNAASAAIFMWWDDLKPQLAGTNVRYWNNGVDSAAVSYENIRAGTAPNQGTYNFQVLLTARGEARVFYGNMGTIRLTSATIGIQNAEKTIGLTVLNNQTGIANNESRRFALGPRWVSVLPVSGIVSPNSTDTLRLSFLGPELCGNPSLSGLVIRSNDQDDPSITIPILATPANNLPAPTELTIFPNGNDIDLRWTAVPGASHYQVEFLFDLGGLPTIVGTPATNSFTHVNGMGTDIGYYQVRAIP